MKPSVHDSLATAARAYFVLQWLVFAALSHWLEKSSTSRVKREGRVAGQREDNDGFLGNLKRKKGHTVFSEANSFLKKVESFMSPLQRVC